MPFFNYFFTVSSVVITRGQFAKIAKTDVTWICATIFPFAWLTDGTVCGYHIQSSTQALWTPSETDCTLWGIRGWAFLDWPVRRAQLGHTYFRQLVWPH